MKASEEISGYRYGGGEQNCSHVYLMPTVRKELETLSPDDKRLFDLGCGNGSVGAELSRSGWAVTGVDPSVEGIEAAKRLHPELNLHYGSAYDDLAAQYGTFPVLISLEVVEHVYAPRDYAKTLASLLEPGGVAIISTPYHGYAKNVVMAVTGKLDKHFTALWDHGHIKFWSIKTLSELLSEQGLEVLRFHRVGRIPALAKSMIAVVRKPETPA